jgi:hypothetical protein
MLATPPVMAQENAPAAQSPAKPAVNVDAPRPAMSTEKLVAMRNALAAQVAVYDSVEQTWRKPTPSEQEQLSQGAPASGEASIITLPNGAKALKGGAAELSFLTIDLQSDGTLKLGHAASAEAASLSTVPAPRLKTAAPTKGGKNAE